MEGLAKYFLSIFFITILFYSCDKMPLEYRLQYAYTRSEQDSLEIRINREINRLYDGSLLKDSKLDTLIAINPDKEEYYRKKAIPLTRYGDYHGAFPLIEKSVQLDPYNGLYFTGWQILYMYRDYERAIEYFSYYDDISTGVDYIWGENINFLLGLSYKQLGQYDKAVEEFDKYILYSGLKINEYAYVYRGIANLRNECLESAIIDFDKALEIFPKCTMAMVYKGETLINQNKCSEAEFYLKEAQQLLLKGSKKTHPYVEVFDEVQLVQVEDLLSLVQIFGT